MRGELPTPDTLTRTELAARLGISLTSLKRRRADGTAPDPLPLAGHARWSRMEVDRFLAMDPRAIRGRRRVR